MQEIEDVIRDSIEKSGSERVLIVSPHLDDAVLSIGATINNITTQICEAIVFTVFAGIPDLSYSSAARALHHMWGLDKVPFQSRRAEDVEALRCVNAIPEHGDFLDLMYRVPAETIEELMEYAAHDHNSELVASVADTIIGLIEDQAPSVVLTCAAIGNHADHRHARDATILACTKTKKPLFLWEDLPYGVRNDDVPGLPSNVMLTDRFLGSCSNVKSFDIKYDAVEKYVSQLNNGFFQEGDFRVRLDDHAVARSKVCGHSGRSEFFWQTANV